MTENKKKKSNPFPLVILIISVILSLSIIANKKGCSCSKTPGYHYRNGYTDRNGKYHKGGVVREHHKKK